MPFAAIANVAVKGVYVPRVPFAVENSCFTALHPSPVDLPSALSLSLN